MVRGEGDVGDGGGLGDDLLRPLLLWRLDPADRMEVSRVQAAQHAGTAGVPQEESQIRERRGLDVQRSGKKRKALMTDFSNTAFCFQGFSKCKVDLKTSTPTSL